MVLVVSLLTDRVRLFFDRTANRRFESHKRGQLFLRTHNEAFSIVALAVLAIATASGQTPTPTPECTRCDLSPPFPNCTPMPPDRTELFGTAQDNSPLYWDVYIPQPPDPAGPWPVVVIIHGGGFS